MNNSWGKVNAQLLTSSSLFNSPSTLHVDCYHHQLGSLGFIGGNLDPNGLQGIGQRNRVN